MGLDFSIKVYKQYFNFASSHFLIFADGSREPLHGHNYHVTIQGKSTDLSNDMVFDFLDIKPIVRKICDSLDHRLLLPGENPLVKISFQDKNIQYITPDGDFFSFPEKDVLILPLTNISAERLAMYMAKRIKEKIRTEYNFNFPHLEVEVEETPGQSASYILKE